MKTSKMKSYRLVRKTALNGIGFVNEEVFI